MNTWMLGRRERRSGRVGISVDARSMTAAAAAASEEPRQLPVRSMFGRCEAEVWGREGDRVDLDDDVGASDHRMSSPASSMAGTGGGERRGGEAGESVRPWSTDLLCGLGIGTAAVGDGVGALSLRSFLFGLADALGDEDAEDEDEDDDEADDKNRIVSRSIGPDVAATSSSRRNVSQVDIDDGRLRPDAEGVSFTSEGPWSTHTILGEMEVREGGRVLDEKERHQT